MPAAVRGALFLGGASAANAPLLNIASAIPCGLLRNTLTALAVSYSSQRTGQREHGGRGRIRTSVARKERQIYSLLVLATHPPVLEKS